MKEFNTIREALNICDCDRCLEALSALDALEQRWRPGRWWRVVTPSGRVWCETSVEAEARRAVRPGDKLQRQMVTDGIKWVDAT